MNKIVKDNVNDKLLAYNRANRAVAILCNHQRAVPKTFAKSMENMQTKVNLITECMNLKPYSY
jgi:DNA topoisomerase-1